MTGKILRYNSMFKNKEISCRELTLKYLDKIEENNKKLNAYVKVTEKTALEAADRVDEKIIAGEDISILEGIPMSLKDNISTKGIETTCCSKMLKGYVPIYDATVWRKLKSDNAVLLGKSNMDEFAMGSSCETSIFGGCNNPYNLSYVSGGSSGGAAASVSGGLAAYALGSDTGGSVRQPAGFCGSVGLKPTYGAVSRYGLIAYASGFDQIGPIASCVEDTAVVYDAISFYDDRDSTSSNIKRTPTFNNLKNDIKGLKVGIPMQCLDGAGEDIVKCLKDTCNILESMGAEIQEFSMPSLEYAVSVYYILACAQASSNLGRYDGIRYGHKTDAYQGTHEMMCKSRREGFGKEVRRRIMLGTYVLSAGYYDAYYKKAEKLRCVIVQAFDNAFAKYDLILSPTTPTTAFKTGFAPTDPIKTYLTDICTVPANIAGLPALSLPCGFDRDKLPIGLQLIGNKFAEGKILNTAWQIENAINLNMGTKWGAVL